MANLILRVLENTVFKLRPEDTSELRPEELHAVTAGSTYPLHSYAYADAQGDFRGHIKFALKNTAIRGLNTWFVQSSRAQVELDGQVVYPLEDQEAVPILRVTKNTVFKQRPVQSSQLAANERHSATAGQSFDLHSYAYADAQGDFSSHIKFALRYRRDYINGLSTWFVYDQHAYVEFDGKVVYPPEAIDMPILRVIQNTVFKRRPVQSSQLAANERFPAAQGSQWKLHSYAYADAQGRRFNGHIKFTLRYEQDYIQQFSTWYVFEQHAVVERNGVIVYPQPSPIPSPRPTPTPTPRPTPAPSPRPTPAPRPTPSPPPYRGTPFRLPGNTSTFYTDQPIIPGGDFTWGEATRDATRIPTSVTTVNNIIALARQLQRARDQIGRPFQVNSWYRPPAVNQAVGGVPNSQHLFGRAADVQVPGLSGRRVANAVMLWWPGGIGIYSNIPDIVHLDIGPKRTWGF